MRKRFLLKLSLRILDQLKVFILVFPCREPIVTTQYYYLKRNI